MTAKIQTKHYGTREMTAEQKTLKRL